MKALFAGRQFDVRLLFGRDVAGNAENCRQMAIGIKNRTPVLPFGCG